MARPSLKRLITEAIRKELALTTEMGKDGEMITKAEAIARVIVDNSVEGHEWAIKLTLDRSEGKVPTLVDDVSDDKQQEKLTDLSRSQLNSIVEQANDENSSGDINATETPIGGTVPESESNMDLPGNGPEGSKDS